MACLQMRFCLRDVPLLLQMIRVLEIRARRIRKSLHRALCDLRCRGLVARYLVCLDREEHPVQVIAIHLHRGRRQLRRFHEIAAFVVFHRHHLHQPLVSRLQLQGFPPGAQRIFAPAQFRERRAPQVPAR